MTATAIQTALLDALADIDVTISEAFDEVLAGVECSTTREAGWTVYTFSDGSRLAADSHSFGVVRAGADIQ